MSVDLVVEVVPIGSLKPDPRNARKHGGRNLAAIAESLSRFGQRRPLVVTSSGVIVAGNGTWEAARELLGWSEIAITRFPSDDPDEVKAYALTDNRTAELAEWDTAVLEEQLGDLAAAGWDVEALGFDRPGAAKSPDEIVEDDPGDLPPEPYTRPGDLWLLGEHRLLCGDATSVDDLARVLGDDVVDVVFTDPPYGVSYVGGTADALTITNDDLGEEALHELLLAAFRAFRLAMRPGAPFYVCAPSGPLETVFRRALEDARLALRQQLVWVKNAHVLGRSDYHGRHETLLYGWAEGVPPPIPEPTELAETLPDVDALYDNRHDTVLYGWRDGAKHTFTGGRRQNTVWEFPRPTRSAEHPTMKPVALCAKALLNSGPQGIVVLDPFAGSGSTLIAAEQTARRARVLELDPRYADVIARRWQAFTGRLPVLEASGDAHDFAPPEVAGG